MFFAYARLHSLHRLKEADEVHLRCTMLIAPLKHTLFSSALGHAVWCTSGAPNRSKLASSSPKVFRTIIPRLSPHRVPSQPHRLKRFGAPPAHQRKGERPNLGRPRHALAPHLTMRCITGASGCSADKSPKPPRPRAACLISAIDHRGTSGPLVHRWCTKGPDSRASLEISSRDPRKWAHRLN